MRLSDIIRSVGGAVVREAVPGGGLLVDVVNEFLPSDKRLGRDATGADVDQAVSQLPQDQRIRLLGREFDVDETRLQESYSTLRTMLEADAKGLHTTRPRIALGAFRVVAFVVVVSVTIWAVGVLTEDDATISAVTAGWPFLLSAIGPLVVLLHAYFGVLRTEQRNRLDAARGVSTPSGLAGILAGMFKQR